MTFWSHNTKKVSLNGNMAAFKIRNKNVKNFINRFLNKIYV